MISIEISSVWFAGATNLYSREFYEMAQSRLKTGGVLQQWVQFHHTQPRELSVQIATLRSVFPFVSVWSAGGQGMMVATSRPQELTAVRRAYLAGRLRSLSHIPEAQQAALEAQVFDSRLLSAAAVDRLLSQGTHEINTRINIGINTDHNRWIEYATPRYNWTDDDGIANIAWLKSFAEPEPVAAAPWIELRRYKISAACTPRSQSPPAFPHRGTWLPRWCARAGWHRRIRRTPCSSAENPGYCSRTRNT